MSKTLPSYIRIYEALRDLKWHNRIDFCRPQSEDTKRLREMHLHGWIEYETKINRGQDGNVISSEYRLTRVDISWFDYYHKYVKTATEPNGQLIFI